MLLGAVSLLPPAAADAQIVLEPLFEYPVAPDSISTLQGKSDYLMRHFWDGMDFKTKTTVDQNALNDAFKVYITSMRFADAKEAEKSIDNLLASIARKEALQYQFTRAAEENLYSPRAEFWNDALYLKFLDALLSNKKVKNDRKVRFRHQSTLLRNTLVGAVPPQFEYEAPSGTKCHFSPDGVVTVIEFGDPDCDECRLSKLKMETDVSFNSLVDRGLVNVLFIDVNPEEGWQAKLEGFPQKWHCGASDEVADLYDLRSTPTFYVIDKEGRIAVKNVGVADAMRAAGIIQDNSKTNDTL